MSVPGNRSAEGGTSSTYTLVVAVANPAHAEQLMRTAVDLAVAHDGTIVIVSVVHKPSTSPFLLFEEDRIREEFADPHHRAIDAATHASRNADVPITTRMPVGDDVSRTIQSVIADVQADALLLGWQKRSRTSDFVLGTTVDPLVKRAQCDVYLERIGNIGSGIDHILLPTDGGPHISVAADLAAAVARSNQASVHVVSYVQASADEERRERAREHITTATERLTDIEYTEEIASVKDIPGGIIDACESHDFVVLGATRTRQLQHRLIGSVARDVGGGVDIPVVIARAWTAPTFLDRLLPW